MKKIILMFILTFLFFNIIYGVAEIRNLYVTGNCYTPGQYITVNFEVRCSWGHNVFGDIIFSRDQIADWNDDAVLTAAGPQDPPDNNGHNGVYISSQLISRIWYQRSYVVKVPLDYSGLYYIYNSKCSRRLYVFMGLGDAYRK